ncbi:MAG: hypothetical protein AYW82_05660 [Bifidobacterium dentium]|nr:MAG: hypothetical protein AYW82_05660 [Bifidobacterium dentium]
MIAIHIAQVQGEGVTTDGKFRIDIHRFKNARNVAILVENDLLQLETSKNVVLSRIIQSIGYYDIVKGGLHMVDTRIPLCVTGFPVHFTSPFIENLMFNFMRTYDCN